MYSALLCQMMNKLVVLVRPYGGKFIQDGGIIYARWRNNLCRRLASEVISMQDGGAPYGEGSN